MSQGSERLFIAEEAIMAAMLGGRNSREVAYELLSELFKTRPIRLGVAERRTVGNVAKEIGVPVAELGALLAEFATNRLEQIQSGASKHRIYGTRLRPELVVSVLDDGRKWEISYLYLSHLLMEDGLSLSKDSLYRQLAKIAKSTVNTFVGGGCVLTQMLNEGIRTTYGFERAEPASAEPRPEDGT